MKNSALTRSWVMSVLVLCVPPHAFAQNPDPIDPIITQCEGPAGDPAPNTPEFAVRDAQNMVCSEQRNVDLLQHPVNYQRQLELYGADPYREPHLHDGQRFRHDALTVAGAAADVFRPCTAADCENMPDGLETFEPPYPVVIALHGAASDKDHLWWATQPLAERGYFVVTVNGTGSGLPGAVLDWLHGEAQIAYPGELDLDRVGITGHSLGAENSTRTQGDPRVSAIIGWDPCNSAGGCSNSPGSRLHDRGAEAQTPTLIIAADYSGFPGYPQPRFSVPGTLRAEAFEILLGNGVDSLLITPRATTHLDWAGTFTFGSRYNEATSNHYGLAWFDRYLKGKLVVNGAGNVVTSGGRSAAEERAYRQAVAEEAFGRLVAERFDGTVDRHNISQGFYDPAQAASNADPLLGGNVPYKVAGLPLADRLSFYYRSVCFLSVPDYSAGTGAVGDPIRIRATTGLDGDMRADGCPVTFSVVDSDGDGFTDDVDQCPQQFSETNQGCPEAGDPDSDGDGISDSIDQCPDTPAGVTVDARGCEAASGDLTVSLSADPTRADVTDGPQTVTFTANATSSDPALSGALTYVYYFGDGTNSGETSESEIAYDYDKAGTYFVTVVVYDENANSASDTVEVTMTSTVTVEEPDPIQAALAVTTNQRVAPVSATLDASGSQNTPEGTLYTFDFGDGSAPRTTTNPIVVRVYPRAGQYAVRVTVTDPNDAENTSEATGRVDVDPPQQTTALLSVSPSSAVVNQTQVQFDASDSVAAPRRTITRYTFDFYGDGSETVTQSEPVASFVYGRTGSFEPKVTVTDSEATESVAKAAVAVSEPSAGTPNDPAAPTTSGAGGSFGWPLALTLLLGGVLRRRRGN